VAEIGAGACRRVRARPHRDGDSDQGRHRRGPSRSTELRRRPFPEQPLGCPPVGYQDRKPLDDAVSHCLLYDGSGPDARLIGVKYLVSDEVYRRMPPEERLYWHVHQCEGDAGLPTSTTKSRSDEMTTGAQASPVWGQGVSHLAIRRRLPARAVPALLVGHGRTALGPAPRRPGPVRRPVESSLNQV